jgi:hypothetical protein
MKTLSCKAQSMSRVSLFAMSNTYPATLSSSLHVLVVIPTAALACGTGRGSRQSDLHHDTISTKQRSEKYRISIASR